VSVYVKKFLYHLGPRHVRLYDLEKDGDWGWTKDGMVQVSPGGGSGPEPDGGDDENARAL
jgi:hypothetical protein